MLLLVNVTHVAVLLMIVVGVVVAVLVSAVVWTILL